MNVSEKLPGLRLPALARSSGVDDERLLQLFWNRAELKKELQGLDDQLHGLRNRVKQQESANSRLQDQIEQLESLLGSQERGPEALVHFALRNLWRECRAQLEQFREELHRQREEHERKRQLAQCQQDRQERLRLLKQRLAQAQSLLSAEEQALNQAQAELARLKGFWNYFRRRERARGLESRRKRVADAAAGLAGLQEARRTIEKEALPEFPGVSVEGRRAINLALISYAQLLFTRLSGSGVARDARLATHRRVQDVRYGARAECIQRLDEIFRLMALVKSRSGVAPEVRSRSDKLKKTVVWRAAEDVVPTPASVPSVGEGGEGGNVLIDDYWDVYKVLLR